MRHTRPHTPTTRSGQSTLEYILVVAAIILALIAVATNLMRPAVEKTLTDSSTAMKNASGKLQQGLGL